MPIDGAALARALGRHAPLPVHHAMCQRDLAAFGAVVTGDAIVACTQEKRLLGEVSGKYRRQAESKKPDSGLAI